MGRIRHNAMIITSFQRKDIEAIREKAVHLFANEYKPDPTYERGETIITPIMGSLANNYSSFCIVPDGSKEGWGCSDNADLARSKLADFIDQGDFYASYVDVRFGGDESEAYINRTEE